MIYNNDRTMQVRVINRRTMRDEVVETEQRLFNPWMPCATDDGLYELRPYTNLKNGLPGPQVVEPVTGRWLQASTVVHHQGGTLVDAGTGEDVTVDRLSAW